MGEDVTTTQPARAGADRTDGEPLAGLRVAVTRPRAQASGFAQALEARGAEAIVCPLIRIASPVDPEPLRRAARAVAGYDWIVFTSVNGVDRFMAALRAEGLDPDALGPPRRVACIGPATESALARHGIAADVVPAEYVAEAVLDALVERTPELAGTRVLMPRAAGARAVLREELQRRGAVVDEVEAYRSVRDDAGAGALRDAIERRALDVVTFTSSSTVDQFVAAVGADAGPVRVAAIGPITAETARRHGLVVDIQATEYTIAGLVDALCAFFGATGGGPAATH